jgi:hypothetical protein
MSKIVDSWVNHVDIRLVLGLIKTDKEVEELRRASRIPLPSPQQEVRQKVLSKIKKLFR